MAASAPNKAALSGISKHYLHHMGGQTVGPIYKRQRSNVKASATAASLASKWDQTTNTLVSASSVPFSILVLPQVIQNAVQMTAGNNAALAVISWEGYLSSLLGNTLMCSHFANSGERSAVTVQLIGIANNLAVLLQVALASYMPWTVFVLVTAAIAFAVFLSWARLKGSFNQPTTTPTTSTTDATVHRLNTWRTWQLVSGILGLSVVAQVLYGTLFPAQPSMVPGLATLTVLAIWFANPANQKESGRFSLQSLPGWASTLLFAVAPLPQLVRNFMDAGSLEGLSVGTMLLALTGNALMVPRALLVRDLVWLLGTCWACCAGWGQLLSMFLRKSPTTGLQYVEPPVFVAVTIALVTYFAFVINTDKKAKACAVPT